MVVDGIVRLAETGQGDVVQLKNVRPPQWRLRVGDWRVRFKKHVQEQRLEILHIRHRSKAYDR